MTTIYKCCNSWCGQYNIEFKAMSIKDATLGTARRVSCPKCGQTCRWVKTIDETIPEDERPKTKHYI